MEWRAFLACVSEYQTETSKITWVELETIDCNGWKMNLRQNIAIILTGKIRHTKHHPIVYCHTASYTISLNYTRYPY